jgi:hypothetical protein
MTLLGLNFRGCNLRAEWRRAMAVLADGHHPSATLGNRSNFIGCASARGRVSKTQLTPGGTEAACQIKNRNSKIKNLFGAVAEK